MISLLLATRNLHKAREVREILGSAFELEDLSIYPQVPEVIESGKTFQENACLKAIAVAKQYPGLVIADDSGLEVDALRGAPGIFSARYAREDATAEENIEKLLRQLAHTASPTGQWSGRFRCVVALADAVKVLGAFEGVVEGRLVERPQGNAGFGYDPVFVPSGYDKTLAELPAGIKNQISHRAKALEKLKRFLETRA